MTNPANPRQTLASTTDRTWWDMPPAADTKSQVKDGHPMDAGTWTILQNNINVALDIAPRQLFTSVHGSTFTTIGQPTTGGWLGALLEDVPDATERAAAGGLLDISWGTQETAGGPIVAERHGPFPAVRDYQSSITATAFRRVKVSIRGESSAADHFFVSIALTATSRPPTEGFLTWSGWDTSTPATVWDKHRYLTLAEPGVYTLPSGVAATIGGAATFECYWIWIGWKHDGTGTHKIHSISAMEYFGDL